jgi:hypothetical protein
MIRCPRRIAHQRDCTQPCPIATIAITICSAQPRLQWQLLLELRSNGGHNRITGRRFFAMAHLLRAAQSRESPEDWQ